MAMERDVYDEMPYPNGSYPDTHPDRIAVMARLHGLRTAAVETCRVLEVGCSEGGNLIPMAYAIPGAQFVGFDLAGVPIARGQERIAELGLENIRLYQGDLMMPGLGSERFDYIIAHGVYAWVPQPVRDGLLRLCREHLSETGVAFISYAAMPGGHVSRMVGDFMRQGAAGIENPEHAAVLGLEYLRRIVGALPVNDPMRAVLEREVAALERRGARVYFHDEMAPAHRPVSVAELTSHAAHHGLQYVAEATLPPPTDPSHDPEAIELAKAIGRGDPIAEEQVYDSLRMRTYRETLLCRAEAIVSREPDLSVLPALRFGSQAASVPAEAPALRAYTLPFGVRVEGRHVATVAVMEPLIAAWPETLTFPEIRISLQQMGIPDDPANEKEILSMMMKLVTAKMIELHAWKAPVSRTVAERPRVTAGGRAQARSGNRLTTLTHATLSVTDARLRVLIDLLDGSRNREALAKDMLERLPEIPGETIGPDIEQGLQMLNRMGALHGSPVREDGKVG